MRTATTIEAAGGAAWSDQTDFVVEAEKLGLDICWVAEAWGSDAPSALGFYAARTDRMLLGSAVMQVGTRTPVALAQTAITLSNLSGGRFLLGLGPSGPQVMEGLHGVPFARPLARVRETVEIVRQVMDGGKISYSGSEFQIPLPGGEAVPMRISQRAQHRIPIYLAALSPAMLKLTGRIADGWLGTSFVPEGAGEAYFTPLDEGLARSGRSRAELDVCQGAEVAFAPDEEALGAMVADRKKELAFSLGGMGSASTNFYNHAYSRQGWADVAAEVRERWQAGDRDGAAGTGHRRDGAGNHADRHGGHGATTTACVARLGCGHRPSLPGRRDPGCPAGHTGQGDRTGSRGRWRVMSARKSFANWPCSIARTVDLLGDAWTSLLLREAFYGSRRFDEFQQELGIARNTLADRLRRLVDEGLMERRLYESEPPRHEYLLTEKGRDFFPVLAAMARWGDQWLAGEEGAPVTLHHDACGHDAHPEVVCSACGDPMRSENTSARMGPGYPEKLRERPDVRRRFARS